MRIAYSNVQTSYEEIKERAMDCEEWRRLHRPTDDGPSKNQNVLFYVIKSWGGGK